MAYGTIGGGRYARGEMSGDKRRFEGKKIDRGSLLLRLWKYLGRNRILLILAIFFSVSGSVLALYGPKLSGKAWMPLTLAWARWILTPCSAAPS